MKGRLSTMWVKSDELSLCCHEITEALSHTIRNLSLFLVGPESWIVTLKPILSTAIRWLIIINGGPWWIVLGCKLKNKLKAKRRTSGAPFAGPSGEA